MRIIFVLFTLLLFSSCVVVHRAESDFGCAHGCKTDHKNHAKGGHDDKANHKAEVATATDTTNAIDAKNTVCPVSGEPVNGQDFVVYEGKKYGLCCPECKDMFLKDPAKYIKNLETKINK
jgi:YHS domain-containing protein